MKVLKIKLAENNIVAVQEPEDVFNSIKNGK